MQFTFQKRLTWSILSLFLLKWMTTFSLKQWPRVLDQLKCCIYLLSAHTSYLSMFSQQFLYEKHLNMDFLCKEKLCILYTHNMFFLIMKIARNSGPFFSKSAAFFHFFYIPYIFFSSTSNVGIKDKHWPRTYLVVEKTKFFSLF